MQYLQSFFNTGSADYAERLSAPSDLAVDFDTCSFSWGADKYSLAPITLQVKAGAFAVVVGRVGSGKLSFLSAICSEMPLVGGNGCVNGRIGYVEQKPWIMNATFRENVLMGADYDEAWFAQVVDVCALAMDVRLFPDGDMTMMCRSGVNLFGEQKARLALARSAADPKADVSEESAGPADNESQKTDKSSKHSEQQAVSTMWPYLRRYIELSGYSVVAIVMATQCAKAYAMHYSESLRIELMTDNDPATMLQSLKHHLVDQLSTYFEVTRNFPRERPRVIESNRLPPNWPEAGEIESRRLCLRYQPEGSLVLNSLSFVVRGMEKIGIVGRTGGGKSSLTFALLRLVEADSGNSIIDGIDISTIGLRDLRSRISIIPQDPALFQGTI
ncbi:hypothetical protein GGI04_004141, partial [Coemansia thaxteri]